MVLYPERRMTITGMNELLEFEERFRNYRFGCLMRVLERYGKVLVYEFYTDYKGEM